MTWLRIEDTMPWHPKVVGLSDRAFRLHIMAMCWAAQHLTDGHVPTSVLADLRGTKRLAADLVRVRLWEPNGDGWAIHDWSTFNPSRATVEARRKTARERQRRWRERGEDGRYTDGG